MELLLEVQRTSAPIQVIRQILRLSYQNNVYLVWTDDTTGNGDIYFKGSVDNGTTFSETRNLSINNTSPSSGAQISAIGNNVYVVWQDMASGSNEIYYRYSNNTGERFRGCK